MALRGYDVLYTYQEEGSRYVEAESPEEAVEIARESIWEEYVEIVDIQDMGPVP